MNTFSSGLAKAVQTRAPLSLSEADNRKLKWNLEVIWPLPLGGRHASSKPCGWLAHDNVTPLIFFTGEGKGTSALGSRRREIHHVRVLTLNQILGTPPNRLYLNQVKVMVVRTRAGITATTVYSMLCVTQEEAHGVCFISRWMMALQLTLKSGLL